MKTLSRKPENKQWTIPASSAWIVREAIEKAVAKAHTMPEWTKEQRCGVAIITFTEHGDTL